MRTGFTKNKIKMSLNGPWNLNKLVCNLAINKNLSLFFVSLKYFIEIIQKIQSIPNKVRHGK